MRLKVTPLPNCRPLGYTHPTLNVHASDTSRGTLCGDAPDVRLANPMGTGQEQNASLSTWAEEKNVVVSTSTTVPGETHRKGGRAGGTVTGERGASVRLAACLTGEHGLRYSLGKRPSKKAAGGIRGRA